MKTKSRKYKRKTRKGGQEVIGVKGFKTEPDTLHDKDCGASVIKFLKYATPDIGNYLAEKTPNGIPGYMMLTLLRRSYNERLTWVKIDDFSELRHTMKKNEATIGSYGTDGNGHYFVVFRMGEGLFMFDPQSGKISSLEDYLDTLYKKDTFYVCESENEPIQYGDSRITKELIDELFPSEG